MKLYLAPMEGVVDFTLRDLLTTLGGIDLCTTEFIRVTNQLLPDFIFLRYCPELSTQSQTKAGVPVIVQLLGGDPQALAENAAKACALGAYAIDLNFGCPAKLVNRHDGGATLLKSPERIFKIVEAVRKATPSHIDVSAKIRLGFDDPAICCENAQAVQAGGANRLTVHCRTKLDFYKPPAYWHWLPLIKEALDQNGPAIPVVANGDIVSVEDLKRCQAETACTDFMIGRGALQDPFIFCKIKQLPINKPMFALLFDFFMANKSNVSPFYAQAKSKQLLRYMSIKNSHVLNIFDRLKILTNPDDFEFALRSLKQPESPLGFANNESLNFAWQPTSERSVQNRS